MNQVLEYIHMHIGQSAVFLVLLVGIAVMWNLYCTEKRRASRLEKEIRQERSFYNAFSEEEGEFFLYLRKEDLEVQYVSPNFEKMTGYPQEAAKADPEILKKIFDRNTQRSIRKQIDRWDGSKEFHTEALYHRQGIQEQRCMEIHITSELQNGCYLAAFHDITEEYERRRNMEKELWTAQKESQSKTNFLSQMSHEIRTPMNGILGMLSLMRTHLGDASASEGYLNRTEELSKFLLTLINDILDISRIESGKMELEETSFDLVQLADKLDAMFRSTAESKGINWKIKMQDLDVRYVIGDEMRLSQVIINFISNANKFTPAGGTVEVTFRQMDKLSGDLHLMIRVRDTGKGIKEDFIDKIFRPFEQEDASTAHNYGGSGLGMAIADSIIKLMNGEILVESEEGRGTEFTVYLTLPIDQEREAHKEQLLEEAKISEAQAKAVEAFTIRGLNILLAEDNDINAEIAIEILQMDGAKVIRAVNGVEAVQIFTDSAPGSIDVILMDIQMPHMNGYEATKVIRRLSGARGKIPIIAMTANAFEEDRRKALESGMNAHIAKPFSMDTLLTGLDTALNQKDTARHT